MNKDDLQNNSPLNAEKQSQALSSNNGPTLENADDLLFAEAELEIIDDSPIPMAANDLMMDADSAVKDSAERIPSDEDPDDNSNMGIDITIDDGFEDNVDTKERRIPIHKSKKVYEDKVFDLNDTHVEVLDEIKKERDTEISDERERQLKQKIADLEIEQKTLKEKLLRSLADFDNFRKRNAKDIENSLRQNTEKVLLDFITVLDNFDRAMNHVKGENSEQNGLLQGLDLVYKLYCNTLKKYECVAFESVGKEFDPVYHDAFHTVENPDVPNNFIVEELQKGYMLGDIVLRPALVVISKNPNP